MDDWLRPLRSYELVARLLSVGLGIGVVLALAVGPSPLVVVFLVIGAIGLFSSVAQGAARWIR